MKTSLSDPKNGLDILTKIKPYTERDKVPRKKQNSFLLRWRQIETKASVTARVSYCLEQRDEHPE